MHESELEIRDLLPGERDAAVALVARGMRDNPMHVAAYGDDPRLRVRRHARLMRRFFTFAPALEVLVATWDGAIVGVGAAAAPGTCGVPAWRAPWLVADAVALGPAATLRVVRWLAAWRRRDPREPHAHFGPLAVEPELQGHGIGSRLLGEHCRRFDARGTVAYLETDSERNVRLYRRFGFEPVAETRVLGVPNWFMSRAPRAEAQAQRPRQASRKDDGEVRARPG